MRVLLIAEAANPEWTSVPLVGWSLCQALARRVDAHVVTQVRNRPALERAGWVHGREFTALDTEWAAAGVSKLGNRLRERGLGWTVGTALSALPYYAFEAATWARFGDRIRRGDYDIVHRVTPLSPTTPSPLAAWCDRVGVPFVWGPINGGVPWPSGFGRVRRREGEWLSFVRGAHRLLPGYLGTRRHAAAILVGSRATESEMPAASRSRCVHLPENGIEPARFPSIPRGPVRRPLRVVFVGRLVPYKGADVLLDAAAPLIRAGAVTVEIVGDGPEMPALRRLVDEAGLETGVTLAGWVPHAQVHERLARADVLGFPSIREFGGGVVLEAMAMGLVPVVADHGGPSELVTEGTGFRLDVGSRAALMRDLHGCLARLAEDPSSVRSMGERARRRAMSLFTWDAKAAQVARVYDWVLDGGDKPDLHLDEPGPVPTRVVSRVPSPARRVAPIPRRDS